MDNKTLPTLPTPNDNTISLAGDWHGSRDWAKSKIREISDLGVKTLLHLGDFGVWGGPNGQRYLDGVEKVCKEVDVTIFVTLGNHENYDMVNQVEPDDLGIRWIRPHIALFPRVFRFEHMGHSFLSLGGAPSIDYKWRTMGYDWWLEEMMTEEQADEAISGGPADIMLTHDAPDNGTRSVQSILNGNPQGWPRGSLAYAKEGRDRLTRVVSEVQPEILFHGHYHAPDSGYLYYPDRTGEIHSLGCDGQRKNVAIFDFESFDVVDFL